ncbi:MAG: hypothetical protein A6F71_01785 [Cycloclasticus sp. symbiont of Poecilosclerida sp. M]|nr:MAG: hypothetical protein A6F71_01785 [Cycloclasticus sp. symbiont of Poecilosclerida sp. M]
MLKLQAIGQFVLWVFTIGIALVALSSIAVRVLLVELPAYKNNLEAYLSEEIGGTISVGDIAAEVDGYKTQIILSDIQLEDEVQISNSLNVKEIRLLFNPLDLVIGQLKPERLIIVNARLSIKRYADGHIALLGLPENKGEDSSGDFSLLLDDGAFEVVDSTIEWQDQMRDVPDIQLRNASLVFKNTGRIHQLSVMASLPKEIGKPFRLSMRLEGDILTGSEWSGEGYLKVEKINVSQVLNRIEGNVPEIQDGLANLEIWSKWDKARLSQVKGYMEISDVRMKVDENKIALETFSSSFKWKNKSKGWRLAASNLMFKGNGLLQKNANLSIDYSEKSLNESTLNVAGQGLSLSALSGVLLKTNALSEDSKATLEQLKLAGNLNNIQVALASRNEISSWAVCGEVVNFSNQYVVSMPALKNISGTFCSTQDTGWLDLASGNSSITFKDLFRDPLLIESLAGQLIWKATSDGWSLTSDNLALHSPHINTKTRLELYFPSDGKGSFAKMQTDFTQGDVRYVSQYLPVGIMSEGVVEWLDSAFDSGQVRGGSMLLEGTLDGFPYRKNEGIFQVLFQTQGLSLHFADKWPSLEGIISEVEFRNEGMEIRASTGDISGSSIQSALVYIRDLENDGFLKVEGSVKDDARGLYRFFRESPLASRVSTLLEHSDIEGALEVDLDIKIPLREGVEEEVYALAKLQENKLTLPDLNLSIEGISGLIQYDKTGLSAKSLKGTLWGEPLAATIDNTKDQTIIDAKGFLPLAALIKRYPTEWWEKAQGKTKSNVKVLIPHAGLSSDAQAEVTLISDLHGLSIDLPSPLGKSKKSSRQLTVTTQLGEKNVPMQFRYGKMLQGSFIFAENKQTGLELQRGDLKLGDGKASLPTSKGLRLSGFIRELDLSAWLLVVGDKNTARGQAGGINQIDLKTDSLFWSDMTFEHIGIKGRHEKDAWQGRIDSDLMTGEFVLPDQLDGVNVINLDLEKLNIPKDSDDEVESEETSVFDPADIPNVDLRSRRFFIGKENLGRLQLQARRGEKGLSIEKFTLKSKRDELSLKGRWSKTNNKIYTTVQGELESEALGGLLKDADLFDDIRDAPAKLNFDLNWPDAPHAFSKDILSGTASIKSEKGRILNLEPGVGRIFGLLSLNTLKRRLQLDFSDLVQKGFSFDKLKGHFLLKDGVATTDDFYLESPAAWIDMQGSIGLKNEDYNQLVTVTPKTTDSLPVAGALAGGPIVGAAVFVAQKIVGKTVNKLVNYQYQITGSWANPDIKQLSQPGQNILGNMFDVVKPILDVIPGLPSAEDKNETVPTEP